ncbi:MAG: hypothetical protein WDZ35_14130 [Crocinitomicaceae bacterium]
MIERKCLSCGVWNKGEDYCTNCGAALSPKALDKERTEQRLKEEAAIPLSKSEIWMKKAKNSKWLLVRWGYHLMYSITVIAGLIGAFLAWLVAMSNA